MQKSKKGFAFAGFELQVITAIKLATNPFTLPNSLDIAPRDLGMCMSLQVKSTLRARALHTSTFTTLHALYINK